MQNANTETIQQLKTTAIRPRAVNRASLKLDDDFKQSIAERGVQVPILVRPIKDTEGSKDGIRYEVIAGERRWAANGLAGRDTIPAIVREMDDKTAGEAQLLENLQREGFNALDEAMLYQDRIKSGDYGTGKDAVSALGKAINMGASTIYARLRLLTLPAAVRKAMGEGQIEASVADLIATIPDEKQQAVALKELLDHTEWNTETRKQEPAAMSYRRAKEFIEQNFRKSLKAAPFDLKTVFAGTGPGLVTGALPSCEACPKRTGNIPGMPSGSAPNVCTDPKCYAQKVARNAQQLLEAEKAKGHAVVEGDSTKLWQYGSLKYDAPFVDGERSLWIKDKHVPVTKALGKKMPAPVYAVDPGGALVKLYPKDAVNQALIAAKLMESPSEKKVASKADQEKAAREEVMRATEVERITGACMKVVENPKLSDRVHALLWAFVLRKMIEVVDTSHIIKRRGIAPSALHDDKPLGPKRELVLEVCRGQAIETLITSSYDAEPDEDDLNTLAKLCGVDTAAISKEVWVEFNKVLPASRRKAEPAGKMPAAPSKARTSKKAVKPAKAKTMAKK